MSKPKKAAIAPAKKVCAACGAEAPAGSVEPRHKNCPKKEVRTPLYVAAASATPTDITRFIPQKAAAGQKIGGVDVALEEKKTAFTETTSGEAVWVQPYYWNGNAWLKVGAACNPNKKARKHGEDVAWEAVKARRASWIAFMQNAPPCDDQCFGHFLDLSRTCAGFVFFVTDDKGGYFAAYKKLTQDDTLTLPFVLYMWKGVWSVNISINGGPTAIPKL